MGAAGGQGVGRLDLTEDPASLLLRLNAILVAFGMMPLEDAVGRQFGVYYSLFVRWNLRLNLSSVRDEDGILSRHFAESIACARALPDSITSLLDYGSGAGLPGIPIALCRPQISVTLAESQGRKAAFLKEAIRVLGIPVKVHAQRAEALTERFDCVALRAVDRMETAVKTAAGLVARGGWLALMTTGAERARLQASAGGGFSWPKVVELPGGRDRLLALGLAGQDPR